MGLKVNRKRIGASSKEPSVFQKQARPTSALFEQQLNITKTEQTSERLTQLLTEIEQQGQRLMSSRTARDIRLYKKLVHQFVQAVINDGLGVEQSRAWSKPRGQIQTVVKQIDHHLVALTDHVLSKEAKAMAILNEIGEIKGLLINLYQ